MYRESAECDRLEQTLPKLADYLQRFLQFQHEDAQSANQYWRAALNRRLPEDGVGIDQLLAEMGQHVIPYGSAIPKPSFCSYITTGATTAGVLATLAGTVAAPQRFGLHAFAFLEDLSLEWLKQLFRLPESMQGVYCSGGSVANLLALGAARQQAFEKVGIDVVKTGVQKPVSVFVSEESHHSVMRACSVLGLGRDSVHPIACDSQGRMIPAELETAIELNQALPMAIVGNLGTTNAGAIDPVAELVDIAQRHGIWLHLDGAYGLPGILDETVAPYYDGLNYADSVTVDPHKWLGAPVGIGAAYVKNRDLLQRAFSQEPAAYLEGTYTDQSIQHSLDHMGTPYSDFGIELSAPCRGAVVWALLREIGVNGLRARIQCHNAMAQQIAHRVATHPNLELLRNPMLSICCFRYVDSSVQDLDSLNRHLHRQLIINNNHLPSTTVINGKLAIRPCFIGARTQFSHADELVDEVLEIGRHMVKNVFEKEYHNATSF